MTENWIILGATSSIARAFARCVAENGDAVFLAGRDKEDLKNTASDCAERGAPLAEVVKGAAPYVVLMLLGLVVD